MRKVYLLLFLLLCSNLLPAQATLGLLQRDTDSYDGLTLFAPLASTSTYLIDHCGRLVNRWPSAFAPGISVYITPTGELLHTARMTSTTFSGGGIGGRVELLDWSANVLWSHNFTSNQYHQHHDVEYLPNGNILVILWELKTNTEALDAGINPQNLGNNIWPDMIFEVEPTGSTGANIVWEWHLWDHLIQDHDNSKPNFGVVQDHPELVNLNYSASGGGGGHADWIHTNAVDYNADLDQIVMSSRNFSEIWIIDHSTTTAEAASHSGGNAGKGGDLLYRWGNPQVYNRGTLANRTLYGQHDVNWIPVGYPGEGQLMVYNNGLGRPGGNYSTIDVWQPPMDVNGNYMIAAGQPFGPTAAGESYQDPDDSLNFFSSNISGATRQPNGNTLICEGSSGHLFEVDSSGTTVWDYIVPLANGIPLTQGQTVTGNSTFRCYRYPANYSGFDNQDLTPGDPIEIDPIPVNCDTLLSYRAETISPQFSIYPNPATDWLTVESTTQPIRELVLMDLTGKTLWENNIATKSLRIPLSELKNGLYLLKINQKYAHKVLITHN